MPYPPNYGGIIDVYHKIRLLRQIGVKVILHCFEYGRGERKELESLCEKVYYYPRKTGWASQFSILPYIVKSRTNPALKKNLLLDNYPILFEALHCCYLLNDADLKGRFKIFRESNIEHEYYRHLARAEKRLIKRLYFYIESFKLKRFEAVLKHAQLLLIVSETETQYFSQRFPANKVVYLPSFHPFDEMNSVSGKGDYVLYHGNLMVPENINAAEFFINKVFPKVNMPCIIAGLNPPGHLVDMANACSNVKVIANPGDAEILELIKNAHINCLFTDQPTGLKLKLLNVLFSGRHCVANQNMLAGTNLQPLCHLAELPEEYIGMIKELAPKNFDRDEIEKRRSVLLEKFDNQKKINQLIELIWH